MNELIFTFPQRYKIDSSFTKKIGINMVFIIMEETLKILRKLLDNFIVPKFEDIDDYKLLHRIDIDGNKFIIEFWMDGTEQEVEEEIVEECYNILKYYGLPNLRVKFRFTTEGDNFYDYD